MKPAGTQRNELCPHALVPQPFFLICVCFCFCSQGGGKLWTLHVQANFRWKKGVLTQKVKIALAEWNPLVRCVTGIIFPFRLDSNLSFFWSLSCCDPSLGIFDVSFYWGSKGLAFTNPIYHLTTVKSWNRNSSFRRSFITAFLEDWPMCLQTCYLSRSKYL